MRDFFTYEKHVEGTAKAVQGVSAVQLPPVPRARGHGPPVNRPGSRAGERVDAGLRLQPDQRFEPMEQTAASTPHPRRQ